MQELLFLAHRIPYPPNKGDKVRSWHFLEHLAEHYRVHLGAFLDDPADWQHTERMKSICASTCFVGLSPFPAKLRSLPALAGSRPLTLPYYYSAELERWVNKLPDRVDSVFVYSGAMAQYVLDPPRPGVRRVIDFVDVDSDKWRQYAARRSGLTRWIYAREHRTLLAFEKRVAAAFDRSLFVSPQEAELFRSLAPESAARITHVNNGVDLEYFAPRRDHADPYPPGGPVLVFTGAMDYWANVEAVTWFSWEVLPWIREQRPDVRFYIVGARPTESVRKLAVQPGVHVTGTVDDIRPYLAHATLAVAPLRIARGIQNKVLEAMAMGKPVLASQPAMEGIEACALEAALVSDDARQLARLALEVIDQHGAPQRGARGRECMVRHYGWPANLGRLTALLEGP